MDRPNDGVNKVRRIMKLIKSLQRNRFTIEALTYREKICRRTMYRYIAIIQELGYPIECDFEGRFFIVEGCCPMCSKTNNHSIQREEVSRPS